MRIQHNIMAMNAYRNYTNNTSALSKNLEKLSSGYKINRAGDDAAGLAISEKMRAQITGLNAASKNVKDGISLVKTAEGAMQEIQDMLNRMDYLATQSANGTYQDEVDREALQKEVNQLRDEINRIADSANFNGIKLLDGSLESGAKEISVKGVDSTQVNAVQSVVTNDTALTTTGADAEEGDTYTFTVSLDNGKSYTATAKVEKYVDGDGNVSDTQVRLVNANGEVLTKKIAATAVDAEAVTDALIKDLKKSDLADQFQIEKSGTDKIQFTNLQAGDKTVPQINAFESTVKASTATTATITADKPDITTAGVDAGRDIKSTDITEYDGSNYDDAVFTINGKKFVLMTGNMEATGDAYMKAVAALGPDVTVLVGDKDATAENGLHPDDENFEQNIAKIKEVTGLNVEANAAGDGIKLSLDPKAKGGLSLQIGDTSDSFNQLNISVGDMHTKALGIDKIDIGTQAGAQAAVSVIKDAINKVSSVRGDLGAYQNRLEHTANNLSVMAENIQDAESSIRDTDVAEEMMSYVKNNILVQSAQAMLAQANQVPQGVLQLLG